MAYLGNSPQIVQKTDFTFTATGGQTVFTGADMYGVTLTYNQNNYDVLVNGRLLARSDIVASTGSSITLTARLVNDIVVVRSYGIWSSGTNYTKLETDAAFASVATTVTGAGVATGGGPLGSNSVITVAAANSTQVVAQSNNTVVITPLNSISLPKGAPDTILQDQKASGFAGQSLTGSSWNTRNITTKVYDPLNIVSLSSNQFTPSVNMYIYWSAPGYSVGRTTTRLFNITDSTVTAYGKTSYTTSSQVESTGSAFVIGGKTYRIDQWAETTNSGNGGGVPSTASGPAPEYYTTIEMWRS